MTGAFLHSKIQLFAPIPHPSSFMLMKHRSSQQSRKEEYEPWKWSSTARYTHTKTILPCANIQQVIGSREDLLTIVKRCKLKWYGHVSLSSGLAKTILQGTVKAGRRQGRQKKKKKGWEDNIKEWTGLEFDKTQRAGENREKWRKLVVKSSVVLQRPSRSRDRWKWSDG